MRDNLIRIGIAVGIFVLAFPLIHILMKSVVPMMSRANRAVSMLGLMAGGCLVIAFFLGWVMTRE